MPISSPSVTFSIIPASSISGVTEQKTLIVGQMLAAGTATAGALIIDHPDDGSEDTLFGARSHLAGMVRAFKRENKISQLDIIPLADNGTATKGTATVDFTGSVPTETGTITVVVGSETDHEYELDITDADTATTIGDALEAAITADGDAPFTASNAAGDVTITAENGGTLSGDWGLKVSGVVAGVTISLTGWAAGTNDPSLTGVLDPIASIRYQTIVWPAVYDIETVGDDLDAKFNVTNAVMDGVAIQGQVDTLNNLKTYVSTLNSQSLVVLGQKAISVADTRIGPQTFEFLDNVAAQVAAIRALRLTEDANITRYLTTVASRDQYGGMAIGSLPYFNTALPNCGIGSPADDFSPEDLAELTGNGVATYGPNRAYNGTIMGEFVTTYLTDNAGNPDTSYKYLNTVDTASLIREFYFVNFKRRYAQTRLTDGDLLVGRDMANEASIRAFCAELYDELADEALVQKGVAAKKDYLDNLDIVVTVSEGKVEVYQSPLLVSQIRLVIGTIQINFGTD